MLRLRTTVLYTGTNRLTDWQAYIHLHLIARVNFSNNLFWLCLAAVWGLSVQWLALYRSEITANCRSFTLKLFYLLNNSSINTVQLFHAKMVTHTDEHNEQAKFSGTVPYSLQIYAVSKQPCALNKSLPIGEVTPFDFKNCTELNNLFLFYGWGTERFNIERKQTKKNSAVWKFKNT